MTESALRSPLLQRVRACRGAHAVLLARATGTADRADDLAVLHERDSAFDGHRAVQREQAQAGTAGGESILKRFRRPLESCRRSGLVDGDLGAADLRVVHLL